MNEHLSKPGLADQIGNLEYAIAIALHLLRRASFRRDKEEENKRRALTYALAEALALELREVTIGAAARPFDQRTGKSLRQSDAPRTS